MAFRVYFLHILTVGETVSVHGRHDDGGLITVRLHALRRVDSDRGRFVRQRGGSIFDRIEHDGLKVNTKSSLGMKGALALQEFFFMRETAEEFCRQTRSKFGNGASAVVRVPK